jgi:hypothetical protein
LTGRGDYIQLRRTNQVEKQAIRAPVQWYDESTGNKLSFKQQMSHRIIILRFPIPEGGDICMNKVYVGLDLGSSSFQQATISHEGVKTMNRSYPTSEANLRSAFANLRGEIHVHLEAGEFGAVGRRNNCPAGRACSVFASQGQRLDRERRRQVRSGRRLQAGRTAALNRFKEAHYAPTSRGATSNNWYNITMN